MNLNPIAIGIRFASSGIYHPSLFLDFANSSLSLDSRITFTRGSQATYFDSTGTLQTAGNDVARSNAFQDYNPSTLAPLGFLIEEQRTNSIRNNTMQGAVAGTPGTTPTNWFIDSAGGNLTTRQIVEVGTENGITYIDVRFVTSGAYGASSYFDTATGVAALNGQTWTSSVYVRMVGGSSTNVTHAIAIVENNVSGTFLAGGDSSSTTPTSGLLASNRLSYTRTNTNASTAFVQTRLRIDFTGAADITLRIGLPQLEQGAFATSVIKTTAAAATRLADSASITGANFTGFWNATEGTIVADSSTQSSAGNSFAIQVSDNSYNNRIVVGQDASVAVGQVIVGGSVTLASTSNPARTSSMRKTAFSFIANRANLAAGGTLATADTTGAMVTGMTQINFGSDHAGFNSLNGRLKSVAYYRSALSDPTIQSLTV